ncbi:MAG: rubredoxin [Clostridiales bacterium]|nr:rubredoxin [Bacillota bacterium]NLK04327.1 rubredoxin [Clostridiales bacterium]
MSKYVCTVCGYVYDEALGIPNQGIAAGTSWGDIPHDWLCPLCGATKSEFIIQGGNESQEEKKVYNVIEVSDDMRELSPLEISALCTNLAKGCEKQYRQKEASLFTELARYFKGSTPAETNPNYNELIDLIEKDLLEGIPLANSVAAEAKDRGALRALVWSEKVTRILKSLLTRYQKEGDAMLDNTGVYVCTICGFIYIGEGLPDVCPVCKVPNWKFDKIEGGIAHD